MNKEATLTIPALHCGSCSKTVTRILEALPGVEVTQTNPEAKRVVVKFDESAISWTRSGRPWTRSDSALTISPPRIGVKGHSQ